MLVRVAVTFSSSIPLAASAPDNFNDRLGEAEALAPRASKNMKALVENILERRLDWWMKTPITRANKPYIERCS